MLERWRKRLVLGSSILVMGWIDFPVDNDVLVSKVPIIDDIKEVHRFSDGAEASSYRDGRRKQKSEDMGGLR